MDVVRHVVSTIPPERNAIPPLRTVIPSFLPNTLEMAMSLSCLHPWIPRVPAWLVCAFILALTAAPALAASSFDGFRLDPSPRAASLGGYSIALSDDQLNAATIHPAGIAGLDGRQLSAAYANHPLDVAGGRFSYGYPFDFGYGAISLNYMNYGTFERRANLEDDNQGSFTPNDIGVSAAFARQFAHGIRVGLAATFLHAEIDSYSSNAIAADLSVHWDTGFQMVELAAAITDAGMQLDAFGDTREDLPTAAHLSLAKQLEHLPLKLGLTGHADTDDRLWGTLAGEFTVSPQLRLRAAYTTEGADYEVGGGDDTLAGLSAGLGITWRTVLLDYAFHNQGALGQVHRIGATYLF